MLLAASREVEHGLGFLFPLIFFGLLGYLLYRLFRRWRSGDAPSGPGGFPAGPGGSPNHGQGGASSPMQTLQERFARGEIDQAEYQHRAAVLTGAAVVPPAAQATPTAVTDDVQPISDGDTIPPEAGDGPDGDR